MIYTTGEVASICGVSLRTVINWIQRGRLDAYKLPGTRGDNRITDVNLRLFCEKNGLPMPTELTLPELESTEARKALVVDDDPPMAKAIARLLKRQGFEVTTAFDGFEAGFQFMKTRPVLVTLDLNMPKMDGMAVLQKIKAEPDSARVLVISGEGRSALDTAMENGADAAFAKPFDEPELVAKINALLN